MSIASIQRAAILYQFGIAFAEIIAPFTGALPTGLIHTVLVFALLSHYRAASDTPYAAILPGLALISLFRVLSLVLSFPDISPFFWYALIGIPLLVAVVWFVRLHGKTAARLGRGTTTWVRQALFAGTGIPLSIIAYYVLQPSLPPRSFTPVDYTIAVVGIFLTSGVLQEIIFRGILQEAATSLYGRNGIWFSNVLFTVLYVSTLSVFALVFFHVVGLLFSWWAESTKTVWGVAIAHGLMMVGALVVIPMFQ